MPHSAPETPIAMIPPAAAALLPRALAPRVKAFKPPRAISTASVIASAAKKAAAFEPDDTQPYSRPLLDQQTIPSLYERRGALDPSVPGAKAFAPRPLPNYFLSVQLSHSPGVVAALQAVQGHMREREPGLERAFVDAHAAHITLFVLALR